MHCEEMMEEKQELPHPEIESLDDMKRRECVIEDASPRGVLEIHISGSDSDNSSSSSSSSSGSSSCHGSIEQLFNERLVSHENGNQWKQMFDSIKKKSVRRFSVIPLVATYEHIAKKNLKKKFAKIQNAPDTWVDCEGLFIPKPSWRNFDFQELAFATDNFSSENLIGEGGHAKVFKGCLADGQIVAIKQLMNNEMEEEDRIGDFLSELGIIAHINHPHAAKLLGFSTEGGLHLVLQYLPNGSLASMIHGESANLDWEKRFKVVVGIAKGLEYLHHICPRRIIHRDIKASNILLTEDFDAQISDFGLAKWLPENWLHHIVFPIEGTFGYLAPEYFMHGIADEKTDVFAFGVLLLEIITGRHAVDSTRKSLAMWAKPLLEASNDQELADPRLEDKYDSTEMKRAMLTASLCINHLPNMRPQMDQVVQLLKGEELHIELKQKTSSGRIVLLDGCDAQDYSCSSYLDDLNRHMKLVME